MFATRGLGGVSLQYCKGKIDGQVLNLQATLDPKP